MTLAAAAIAAALIAQARLPEIVPEFLTSWLGVLILFGGVLLMGLTIWEKLRAKKAGGVIVSPDPLQVQAVESLATRAEVEALAAEIEKDLGELRADATRERAKAHAEIVAIHNRINDVAQNTAAMKGHLEEIAGTVKTLLHRALKE